MAPPSNRSRLGAYLDPLQLLALFVYFFFQAIVSNLINRDFRTLFSITALRSRGFANGFLFVHRDFKAFEQETTVPSLVAACHGKVLELGPGAGSQASRYKSSAIEHIYGVEPNTDLGPQLQAAVDEAGLGSKYTVIASGAEDVDVLEKYGIKAGSLDCILSIQVLCSVPKPKEVIAELYKLLKPGGELLVWEHCASEDALDRVVQKIYNPIWSLALCGCSLNRKTDHWLINAGKWDKLELEWENAVPTLFPRLSGKLVKAKD